MRALLAGARASDQPLWEFGLGVGAIVFNDYRGAASVHGYPVPVPYFIYRGDILQADRDGVHGRLLNQRYLEFDFSANATAPVFSHGGVRVRHAEPGSDGRARPLAAVASVARRRRAAAT